MRTTKESFYLKIKLDKIIIQYFFIGKQSKTTTG